MHIEIPNAMPVEIPNATPVAMPNASPPTSPLMSPPASPIEIFRYLGRVARKRHTAGQLTAIS